MCFSLCLTGSLSRSEYAITVQGGGHLCKYQLFDHITVSSNIIEFMTRFNLSFRISINIFHWAEIHLYIIIHPVHKETQFVYLWLQRDILSRSNFNALSDKEMTTVKGLQYLLYCKVQRLVEIWKFPRWVSLGATEMPYYCGCLHDILAIQPFCSLLSLNLLSLKKVSLSHNVRLATNTTVSC